LTGEPKIPYAVGGAKSEQNWREEFRAAGLPVMKPDIMDSTTTARKSSSVEVGISRVYSAITRGELLFFDDLEGLLDELESYSRMIDERGEQMDEIENKSDYHGLDALRYVVAHNRKPMDGKWEIGLPPEGQGGIMRNAPPEVFGYPGRYRNEMDPETGAIRKRPNRYGMDRLREEHIF